MDCVDLFPFGYHFLKLICPIFFLCQLVECLVPKSYRERKFYVFFFVFSYLMKNSKVLTTNALDDVFSIGTELERA